MKNFHSKIALISMFSAVLIGVFVFGAYSVYGSDPEIPSVSPPGSSVHPTFNGVNLTGPMELNGVVGQVGEVLKVGEDRVMEWGAGGADEDWTIDTDTGTTMESNPDVTSTTLNGDLDIDGGSLWVDNAIGGDTLSVDTSMANVDMSIVDMNAFSIASLLVGVDIQGTNSISGKQIGLFYRQIPVMGVSPSATNEYKYTDCQEGEQVISCTGVPTSSTVSVYTVVNGNRCEAYATNTSTRTRIYSLYTTCFNPMGVPSESSPWTIGLGGSSTLTLNDGTLDWVSGGGDVHINQGSLQVGENLDLTSGIYQAKTDPQTWSSTMEQQLLENPIQWEELINGFDFAF